ncbi:hypothetical protein [Caenispirillum salinarum]|uniref:hypothetical protein n=1 Tax=Caenispirillum salinarum TaxID=859058 RepID=UPI00384E3656
MSFSMRHGLMPAVIAIVLTGCAGTGLLDGGAPAEPGPPLPPAELPPYAEGDAFQFDNGVTHHVEGRRDGLVAWGIGDSYDYLADPDFTRPRLSWRWAQEDKNTITSGDAELVSQTGSLWPLRVGNSADYVYRFVSRNETAGTVGDPYLIRYSCRVPNTARVEVPEGTYDTYRVVCDEYWRQRHWQTETWHYAPAVGHVVRHEVRQWLGTNWSTLELTAAGPAPAFLPADQRARLAEAVQAALESNRSGDPLAVDAGPLNIQVTPTTTWKTDAGVFCRRYEQTLTARGRTSIQQGMACRMGDGVWASPEA